MTNVMQTTNNHGITFNVRHVGIGDKWGIDGCYTNGTTPMVEFYDTRGPYQELGQFVSRYYVSTILGHVGGLDLHGGCKDWALDADNMIAVIEWLNSL